MTRLFRPEDTRETYDRVARRYADEIAHELDNKPFDREFLDRLARSVASSGRVAELGCGPGHVAAYLASRGVDVVGVDFSAGMVAEARRLFPALEFVVGDMLALPFEGRSLAGAAAFYSIIHFDDDQLARAFAEMRRVLSSDALLALAFHVGDEVVRREQWWDMPVVVDARFLPTGHVTALLEAAGFGIVSAHERAPYSPDVEYQSRRAYIVARPLVHLPTGGGGLPPMGLGYPKTELRRKLVDAVLRGEKVATAGLAEHFAPHTHELLPQPGDRWALLGLDDEPVAVVETTEARVLPAGEVDLQFARDEGEGFESVADWRAAHQRFWREREISDQTLIVAERFQLVVIL